MKLQDIIARAGRSLKSAKLRTVLTALAIAVGGFTLTLTLAGSNGARSYADKLVASNFDPSELFVGRDPEVANNGTPSATPKEYDDSISSFNTGGGSSGGLQIKRLTRDDLNKLALYPFTESVRESYNIPVRYITRQDQKKMTASAEVYNPAQKPEVEAGEIPRNGDIAPGTIVLPNTYIEVLGFSSAEDALGREVSVTVQSPFSASAITNAAGQIDPVAAVNAINNDNLTTTKTITLKVAAVSKKSATSFSFGVAPLLMSSSDSRQLYDFTTKGTPDYDKYLFAYVRVKNGTNEQAINDAKAALTKDSFYSQSSKDVQKSILQIVNVLQIIVMVFGMITLVASVFGIVNTQYISVLERTREIGLMKALGMRRRDISWLFIIEAMWIGFLGGVIGSLVAIVLGLTLNPTISKAIGFDKGTYLLQFSPLQIAALIIALMVVAMVAGLLPATKAAKLDPIEALRTE